MFPDKLKIAKVIPLYKKNENYIFDNFRPISLLPGISKVFERIMHTQIFEYLDINGTFFKSQYGFRPNHSTEQEVLDITEQIAYQMDKTEIPLVLFLDLSKAFDCLDHNILLHKLKHYGFHNNSCKLIQNYLYNRQQYVNFNDINSGYMTINVGVPQGSILGPLLFLIYINDINYTTTSFRPVIYADDTSLGSCISYFGQNSDEIKENIIKKEISNFYEACRRAFNILNRMENLNSFLEPGQRVQHPNQPDWGIGQVQSNINNHITVNFPEAGKVVIDGSRIVLILVH